MRSAIRSTEINSQQLILDLQRFSTQASASLTAVSTTVAAESTDRMVRELAIRAALRALPVLDEAISHPDPRAALLSTWMICVQGRQNVTGREGVEVYGEQQPLVVNTVTALERDIREIAWTHFGEELAEKVAKEIEAVARENPLTVGPDGVLIGMVPRETKGSAWTSTLNSIASVPLSPFRGFEGVADTPSAIHRFSTLANRTIREMPLIVRLHTELLLLELDELGSVVDARASFAKLSTATESFARTADALPRRLREEIELALADVEESQETLRTTLREAQTTVDAVRGAVQEVEVAGVELTRTAAAWESTAKAVNTVLETAQEFGDDDEESAAAPPEEEGPGALEVWGNSAKETREAADEILVLLRELESEGFEQLVERLEKSVSAPIDLAAERAEALVNRLTLRLYIAIGVVFALVLAYGLLARRVRRAG